MKNIKSISTKKIADTHNCINCPYYDDILFCNKKNMKKEKKDYIKRLIACAWLGLLTGTVLTVWIYGKLSPQTSPEALKQTIEVKAEEYSREYYESDPLRYIRFRGQELGYNDYDISTFIEIARAESGFNLDQYAKNPNSTAKGIYQFIDGTWRAYCLKGGNVYNFVDNINCFYKVLEKDGYPKGLNHWASSQSKWGIK